jgi:hypothetical protein
MSAPIIALSGAVAQRPFHGGHSWVFLQYLLGFRQLGFEVVFIDFLPAELCVDGRGQPCPLEHSVAATRLDQTMKEFGLGESYALLSDDPDRSAGLTRKELLARMGTSAPLINVNGYLTAEEVLSTASLKVFLDIDPGIAQMWKELGLHDAFAGHDAFVTIGENIGREGCSIPTCGLRWTTTRQPVVLEAWPSVRSATVNFTTIGSWRGPNDPIEYGGHRYGLRAHEFRKFVELPRRAGERFELALEIDPWDAQDRSLLAANGWQLLDPRSVAGDPRAYRRYIQGSGAEFMVAKNSYVDTRSGWFSDRSICYLASGKPVLAQDTGFSGAYPAGLGLLCFSSLDDAVAGVQAIAADYRRHAAAARDIAEELFDSRKVLTRLLDNLGIDR